MSEKKHKSGFELLKERLAKAEAENKELQKKFNEERERYNFTQEECDRKDKRLTEEIVRANKAETTIDAQSRKISQLTAELHHSETLRLNADNAHSIKEGEMRRAMGPLRRWWWDLHHMPEFDADEHWHEKGGKE